MPDNKERREHMAKDETRKKGRLGKPDENRPEEFVGIDDSLGEFPQLRPEEKREEGEETDSTDHAA